MTQKEYNEKRIKAILVKLLKEDSSMSLKYKRILVAIDGSYESELAFNKGVNVALRNDATLLLVHVIDTCALQSVATFDTYIYEKLEQEAKDVLDDFEKQAQIAGITNIKQIIEFGNPKTY